MNLRFFATAGWTALLFLLNLFGRSASRARDGSAPRTIASEWIRLAWGMYACMHICMYIRHDISNKSVP